MPVKRASPSLFFPDINRVSGKSSYSSQSAIEGQFPGRPLTDGILRASMLRYFGKNFAIATKLCGELFAFRGDDWCSLADRYRRRLPHGSVNWF